MNEIAKILIASGIVLLAVGGFLLVLAKIPGVGRLPGDILIRKGNFTFYFPWVTSILLSLLATLVLYLWNRK